MIVNQLVTDLAKNRIEVYLDGDRLRYRSPEGALNTDLRTTIGEHRNAIIEHLRKTTLDHGLTSKCVICYRHNWVDETPKNGRIRTKCGKCGRFIGYRPASI